MEYHDATKRITNIFFMKKSIRLKDLLSVQRSVQYDQRNLSFVIRSFFVDWRRQIFDNASDKTADAIISALNDNNDPSVSFWAFDNSMPHGEWVIDQDNGKAVAAKLERINRLKHKDAVLLWHRNAPGKLKYQHIIRMLENQKVSIKDVFDYCGTAFLHLSTDHDTSLRAYRRLWSFTSQETLLHSSKFQYAAIEASVLVTIRERCETSEAYLEAMINLMAKSGYGGTQELKRWIVHMPPQPMAGRTTYCSISRCVYLEHRRPFCSTLKRWLIDKDMRQRKNRTYSVSEVMDWWRYTYYRREWPDTQFIADLRRLKQAVWD